MADGYVGAAIDRDGDVWGQRESGVWRCLTEEAGKFETGELAETYGPLRFTDPAAAPGVKETYGLRLKLRDGELDSVLADVSLNGATYLVKITNTQRSSRNPEEFLTVAVIAPYRAGS